MANRVVLSSVLMLAFAAPAAAQTQAELKDFFEGRIVKLRIDMPGTKDGVNVYPDVQRSVDLGRYRDDLRRYGASLRAGDTAMVTLVKVKDDLIEFQLGGGGFGTFFDDTDTTAHVPFLQKSDRERSLEARLKTENDRGRRFQLERELSGLRDGRDRHNRYIQGERQRISELKRERVA